MTDPDETRRAAHDPEELDRDAERPVGAEGSPALGVLDDDDPDPPEPSEPG